MNKRGEVNPTAIWVIVIFVVVVCAIVFFMIKFKDSNNFKQISVSQDVLISGASLSLGKGDSFVIDFAGLNYNFNLSGFKGESLVLRTPNGNLVNLFQSTPLSFDLDEDGANDLLVSLVSSNGKTAELFLEAPVIEKSCDESWSCSDWSPCLNSLKKRVCVDSNICGSELAKPSILENC